MYVNKSSNYHVSIPFVCYEAVVSIPLKSLAGSHNTYEAGSLKVYETSKLYRNGWHYFERGPESVFFTETAILCTS